MHMRILLTTANLACLLAVLVQSDDNSRACGFNATLQHDNILQIYSPNFDLGKKYPRDVKCTWNIFTVDDAKIVISFLAFEVEKHPTCFWDYLLIRYGGCTSSELQKYCGSDSPGTIFTNSSALCLEFVSDKYISKKGFNASLTVQYDEETTSSTNHTFSFSPTQHFILPTNEIPAVAGTNRQESTALESITFSDQSENIHFKSTDVAEFVTKDSLSSATTIIVSSAVPTIGTSTAVKTINAINSYGTTNFTSVSNYEISPSPTYDSPEMEVTSVFYNSSSSSSIYIDESEQLNITLCDSFEQFEVNSEVFVHSHTGINKEDYNKSMVCRLHFFTHPGMKIHVTFVQFDVEDHHLCSWDSLTFFDGDSASYPQLAKFCGDRLPEDVETIGPHLFVIFTSDHIVTKKGFIFKVTLVAAFQETNISVSSSSGEGNTAPHLPSVQQTSIQSDTFGSFSTPQSSAILSGNPTIVLSTVKTDVPGSNSGKNQVFLTTISNTKHLHTTIASTISIIQPTSSMQGPILSLKTSTADNPPSSSVMSVTPSEQSAVTKPPELGPAEEIPLHEMCSGAQEIVVANKVHLMSPNFGLNRFYPKNVNCEILISGTDQNKLSLEFIHFEVEYHHACSWDNVEVHDGDSVNDPLLGRFCGYTSPDNITSSGQTLYIKFRSDFIVAKRGFKALIQLVHEIHADSTTATWQSKSIESLSTATPPPTETTSTTKTSTTDATTPTKRGSTTVTTPPKLSTIDVTSPSTTQSVPSEEMCKTTSMHVVDKVEIVSPNFYDADNYPTNIVCSLLVSTLGSNKLVVEFLQFEVEHQHNCLWDYLMLYNGQSTSSPLIGKLCGSTPPAPLETDGHQMFVRFKSDSVIPKRGFRMLITSVGEVTNTPQTSTPTTAPQVLAEVCNVNKTHVADVMEIISPGYYEGQYPKNIACQMVVAATQIRKLRVEFEDFEVETHPSCTWDYLSIYDGGSPYSSQLGKFCGKSPPNDIESTGPELFLRFRSDPFVTKKGFKLKVTAPETLLSSYPTESSFHTSTKSSTVSTGILSTPETMQEGSFLSLTASNQMTSSQFLFQTQSAMTPENLLQQSSANEIMPTPSIELSNGFLSASKLSPLQSGPEITLDQVTRLSSSTLHSSTAYNVPILQETVIMCNITSLVFSDSLRVISHDVGTADTYPLNKLCDLNVTSAHGNRLSIVFESFDLEYNPSCSWDYLKVFHYGSRHQLDATFCGSNVPQPLEITSSSVQLKFRSDHVIAKSGFSVLITEISPVSSPVTYLETGIASTTRVNAMLHSESVMTSYLNYIVDISDTVPETAAAPHTENIVPQSLFENLTTNDVLQTETTSKNTESPAVSYVLPQVIGEDLVSTFISPSWQQSQIESKYQIPQISSTDVVYQTSSNYIVYETLSKDIDNQTLSKDALSQDIPVGIIQQTLSQTVAADLVSQTVSENRDTTSKFTETMDAQPTPSEYIVSPSVSAPLTAPIPSQMKQKIVSTPLYTYSKERLSTSFKPSLSLSLLPSSTFFVSTLTPQIQQETVIMCNISKFTFRGSLRVLSHDMEQEDTYPMNKLCDLTVSSANDHKLLIEFKFFDLEYHLFCRWDYLKIYNNDIEKPLIGTFCGLNKPQPLTVSGSSVRLQFRSDQYKPKSGFIVVISEDGPVSSATTQSSSKDFENTPSDLISTSATQTFTSPIESEPNAAPTKMPLETTEAIPFLPVACSGVIEILTEQTGTISSPGYDREAKYPASSDCNWAFPVGIGQNVSIRFVYLDIEYDTDCAWDSVSVYANATDDANLMGRFCGNTIPPEFYTLTASLIIVRFKSDRLNQGNGFNLQYNVDLLKDVEYCQVGRRSCLNGTCVPKEWFCDEENDCSLNEDESITNCGSCELDEFRCDDGQCISAQLQCDGTADCLDNTDEHMCTRVTADNDRLIIKHGKTWYPVCADNWTSGVADGMCKAAGYRETTLLNFTDSQPAVMMVLNDTVDTYVHMNHKYFSSSSNCSSSKAVHLSCTGQDCGLKGLVDSHARVARVVGGGRSLEGQWPWVVAVRTWSAFACGGTLIHPQWVITAGHCVDGLTESPQVVSVFAGSTTKSGHSGETRFVTEISFHPDFNFVYNADIALLRLQRPFEVNDYIRPICLPWSRRVFTPKTLCYIAGWGVVNLDNYYTTVRPNYLHHAKTKIILQSKCRRFYGDKLKDTMICAGYEAGGIDACKGDSGGPLMCQGEDFRWTLAGVTSWGERCAQIANPGVYTRVTDFLDWIDVILGGEDASPTCNFEENHLCGYEELSSKALIWTRRPGGYHFTGKPAKDYTYKNESGHFMFAETTSLTSKGMEAELQSPKINNTGQSCLIFAYMFTGGSDFKLYLYGNSVNETYVTQLWRVDAEYGDWREARVNINADVTFVTFVAKQGSNTNSGVALDEITILATTCYGYDDFLCTFDDGTLCQYEQSQDDVHDWAIKTVATEQNSARSYQQGYYIHMSGLQVLNQDRARLQSKVIEKSSPFCLYFQYFICPASSGTLKVHKSIEFGTSFIYGSDVWLSTSANGCNWTNASAVLKSESYSYRITFEGIRESSAGGFEIGLDNIGIYDGYCINPL